jgi:thiamine kinase-like enzyme
MVMTTPIERVRALPIWRVPVQPEPLGGGITNLNFTVTQGSERFVVRVGDDIPVHQVMRFNERAASQAAFRAGISPEVVHAEPGILVIGFIEGKTLGAEDVRRPETLQRILPLIARVHRDMPGQVRGPALVFWVFHVLRDYGHTLRDGLSRHLTRLPELLAIAEELERDVGPVQMVYGHNDLLPANFIDDGARIWLIDWDYAGFNSPLFDLANLASNNGLSPGQEDAMLEGYFGRPADGALRRSYSAMKCASLLRETLWSMVSEIHSRLEFDYPAYTADYLGRFELALAQHRAEHR